MAVKFISVIILSYNSESTIAATVNAAKAISEDIHVVDSGSSDRTLQLVRELGAQLYFHQFDNYGSQRNWCIENLSLKSWQMHLDADELVSNNLADEILQVFASGPPDGINGFFVPRLTCFLGRPIRHGGMYPIWHMRLFKSGMGKCEQRNYDQHFFVTGNTCRLNSPIVDDVRMSLTEWTNRHNRWSDAEVLEQMEQPDRVGIIQASKSGNPIEQKRALRDRYNRSPIFLRVFLLFAYRYFFKMGFLDGIHGLIFFSLQTFWFKFLVDAKIFERRTTPLSGEDVSSAL